MKGRILIIAGSDSGGGAGIQADIKTVTALGGYAMTAITAVTVQNTLGVTGIHEVPPGIVAAQITAVLSDIGADAIKTGMLVNAATIQAVADALAPYGNIPLILDPVMVAKGGAMLLDPQAVAALKEKLIPRAMLLTPNIPEAEALLGSREVGKPGSREIKTIDEMHIAARELLALGSQAVFLKGGHLAGDMVADVLASNVPDFPASRLPDFSSPRIPTRHTHGTGCTLASAIATGIAQGMTLEDAVAQAHAYVQEAIRTAPGFGKGHGPLGHGFSPPSS